MSELVILSQTNLPLTVLVNCYNRQINAFAEVLFLDYKLILKLIK